MHYKPVLLTINLSDMSTTLYANSDVNASEALFTQKQKRFQQLKQNDDVTGCNSSDYQFKYMTCYICYSRSDTHVHQQHSYYRERCLLTLYCRVTGSIISRGLPLTLISPFPLLQWATAVAVFCYKKNKKRPT